MLVTIFPNGTLIVSRRKVPFSIGSMTDSVACVQVLSDGGGADHLTDTSQRPTIQSRLLICCRGPVPHSGHVTLIFSPRVSFSDAPPSAGATSSAPAASAADKAPMECFLMTMPPMVVTSRSHTPGGGRGCAR